MKQGSYRPVSQLQLGVIAQPIMDMPRLVREVQEGKYVYGNCRTLPAIALEKRATAVEETGYWGEKDGLWSEQEQERGLERSGTVLSFVVEGGQRVEEDYRVMQLEGKYRDAFSIMGDSFLSSFTSGDEIEEQHPNVFQRVHYIRIPTRSPHHNTNNDFTCMTRQTLDEDVRHVPTLPTSCETLKDSEKKTSSSNSPGSPKSTLEDSHYRDRTRIARNFFKPELKGKVRGSVGEGIY